jgi:hypothetical protein
MTPLLSKALDNLTPAELDFALPMVLRFERGRLLDVTSEFSTDVDKQIETLRSQFRPQDWTDFKGSDGALQSGNSLSAQAGRLREVKVKVLEIVWSYLYSGRQQEAWQTLAELWPASDLDRIREVLLKARANGMRAQLDGISTAAPGRGKRSRSSPLSPHRK